MNTEKPYVAKYLRLADEYVELVLSGKKTSTIRKGYVLVDDLRLPLVSSKFKVYVRILKVDYSKTCGDLDDEDARTEGFSSVEELKSELMRFYNDIPDDTPLTIIHFRAG